MAQPQTFIVTNTNTSGAGSLGAALTAAETAGNAGSTVTFAPALAGDTITLTGALPPITQSTTINGAGAPNLTISGGSSVRPFFVGNGTTAINVSIQNVTLANGAATGGAGGGGSSGGGGGMGAGGAIFVNTAANVTLTGVSFTSNAATGGAGGSIGGGDGYGAGGGMGGAGGTGGPLTGAGGGGGGGGGLLPGTTGETPAGAAGGNGSGGGGGGGGGGDGVTSGGSGSANGLQQSNSNGGAGLAGSIAGGNGGGPGGSGGAGGFGGGGGGGGEGIFEASGGGGAGGFGGGGGAGSFAGAGGFGGGGAGTNSFPPGAAGGVGGGAGSPSLGADGGGGAGFGGAVFVAQGGSLTVQGGGTFTGGSATGGTGGGNGAGNGVGTGSDLFGMTGATTVLAPGTGNTLTSNGTIADDTSVSGSGGGLTLAIGNLTNPGGTVVLNGANTYSGGTTVTGSGTTLQISSDGNLGAPGTSVALNDGTTLAVTQGFTFSRPLSIAGDPTVNVASGQSMTISSGITDGSSPGSLALAGGGTLTLTGDNTYTGATTINAGTLAIGSGGSIADSNGVTLTASGAGFDISGAGNGVSVNGLSGVTGSTVSLGGQTLFVFVGANATDSFAGTIQDGGIAGGTGGNVFVGGGGGTLVLSGNNTFTGGVFVNNGTLSISSDGNLGVGGTLTLVDGTTLDITQSGTFTHNMVLAQATDPDIDVSTGMTATWSGVISELPGPSQLTLTGGGTLILTADNTYTGGTTVDAGTLQLGNGGTTGSVMGDITDNSALVFDRSDAVTFAGLITGTGSLTQAGSGTLILTGTDTYSGGTAISAGTLQIGDGTTVGSITGNVTDNGTLAFDHSDTVVYGNTISGTGALTQAGSGMLILTQANTYTGATTIGAGTLALTGSGSIASSSGVALTNSGGSFDISDTSAGATVLGLTGVGGTTVSLGAQTLTVNQASGSETFAGVIQDGGIGGGTGGSLVKSGGGTFALNHVNTYTGATTVNGGILAIVGLGSIASSNGVGLTGTGILDVSDLAGDGTSIAGLTGTSGTSVNLGNNVLTVAVAGGTTNTFGGVIADGGIVANTGGGLTVTGPGTQILTNANTYTGGTTISGGTLQIGAGGTSGSIMGNVTNNAALVFDRSDTVSFPGIISGTGGTTQAGPGTLILTAANTYTGGTTISAGTLQLGNGGTSGGIAGNVTDNGALVFDRSDTVAFTGLITGTGSLIQAGSGTLLLNTNNSAFAGSATVANGTLEVGDAADPGAILGGNVMVNNAGLLRGHGTIGGNLTNAGNVYPGGSIGVMTVAGNYTQTSAGTLTIEITPAVAAGAGAGYDQLKVGGTASLAGTLNIVDDPGTYVVGSRYAILTSTGPRSGTFATLDYNPAFAAYILPVVTYDANDVYLMLDPRAIPSGAQQVPDALTSMVSAMEGVGDVVLGDVCGPAAQRMVTQGSGCVVRPLADGLHAEVWMRGLGGLGSLTGNGGRVGFNDSYSGALIGGDIGQGGFTAGLGGGYLGTSVNFSDGTNASQSAGLGFIYGRYAQGPVWFGAMAAYGGGQVDGTRTLPGTGLSATGNRNADFSIIQARAAYDLPMGALTLEPLAKLAYIHAGQAGFSESGAGLFDLSYGSTDTDVTEGRLALRVMQGFSAGSWALLPWAEAGVQETFSGLSRNVTASEGVFTSEVSGVSPAPTSAVIGAGLTASATPILDVFVAYQGQFSANQTENEFSAGLTFRF